MLQRIQTVFWLLGEVTVALLFFFPLAALTDKQPLIEMWLNGYKDTLSGELVFGSWPLLVLSVLILLIQFFTIFLYRKRVLQMRLTMYNILLLLGLVILGVLYAVLGARELNGQIELQYITIMPVVTIVLNILAWRGVRRDYLLLKAVDRIR